MIRWHRNLPLRHIILIVPVLVIPALSTPAWSGGVAAWLPQHRGLEAHVALAAAKTGKERLSDKSSDEQRLDDCKVPEVRRTKARPATCPAGSDDRP
jgi:hypothetical protein